MESGGYYGRVWSSRDPHQVSAFVLYDLLVPVAPVFLSATFYILFARLVVALQASNLCSIRPRVLTKLFIVGDILCFISQFVGLGLQIPASESLRNAGRVVLVIGLVLQWLLMLWFLIIVWMFFNRLSNSTRDFATRWKRHIRVILACSGAVLLRNLVRIIEYAQGSSSAIATHEVFTYLFDAVPMWGLVAALLVMLPTRACRALEAEFQVRQSLASSSDYEVGKEDVRLMERAA